MTNSMTEGNILKLLISFSIPILFGNLFQQLYNMVDTAIVGQTLGSVSLAAVGSTTSVQFLVLGFCMGLCQGFSILVAKQFGADRLGEMRRYVFNGGILTAAFAVIVTTAVVLLCPTILRLLQVNDEIFDQSYQYLVVIFAGIPFTLLYNYLSAVLRAIGDSKTPFYFLAFSAVLNIFLDFFCILSLHWGVAGAAIATIASQAVSGILCLVLIIKKFEVLHIRKEDRVCSMGYIGSLLAMGLPMGLQFSITAIGSMVMQSANNSLGTVYVSGFAAGAKIKQFVMCPFDAIATACSMFLSQNYGARKSERIHAGYRTSLMLGVGYGIIACLILVFLGRYLSMLFVDASETAVLDASAKYLRRMGYFYPALGILNVSRMSMQGIGYSGRAVVAGVIEMAARCFVSIVFVPIFAFDAITWADQCAWTTAILYLVPMSLHLLKIVDKKIEEENTLERMAAKHV